MLHPRYSVTKKNLAACQSSSLVQNQTNPLTRDGNSSVEVEDVRTGIDRYIYIYIYTRQMPGSAKYI